MVQPQCTRQGGHGDAAGHEEDRQCGPARNGAPTAGARASPIHQDRPIDARSRARMTEIPAAELAVAVHHGPFAELDRTYGAVGTYVAERELGVDGPIREYYLVTAADTPDESRHCIEVCWPIFQTVTP